MKKQINLVLRRNVKSALLTLSVLATLIFSGCQKELKTDLTAPGQQKIEKPSPKSNPLSLRNILEIKQRLNNKFSNSTNLRTGESSSISAEQQLLYIKFDPNNIPEDAVKLLEADSSITIFDFPFANAEIYGDSYSFDETKRESLKDGFLYAVLPIQNDLFSIKGIPTTNLDTLYKPASDEDPLVDEALVQGGYITQEELNLRICYRRPEGFIRYRDNELGPNQPAVNMQVWAIAFGVPIHTYTNETGWFRINWRFLFGTIMGTHAKNPRVNVKPLNTQGAWWLTIPIQFIVGSVHVHGWVGSCSLNNININFDQHRQNRYWAHLLNSVNLHDQYTAADGILNAPRELVIYAHWDDNYGQASAPMLHAMATDNRPIIDLVLGGIFGVNILSPTYRTLYRVLSGYLPDITVKTGNTERQFFSARLTQTALHELGHAIHYRRAGTGYWLDYIRATLRNHDGQCGGGYGCGNNPDDGNVQVGESWGEFIGTNHALRRYPNGQKNSVWAGGFIRFDDALERETWFFNNWIPTGIYNGLMDNFNTTLEVWDNTGGATIQQLYNVFNPDVDFMCDYQEEFLRLYVAFNRNAVERIFLEGHNINCVF